jgi:LAO/AO transport system kinase
MQKTVGVIVIDPTSPFSGGAILGDRVRMQQHATDKGVFIRSMATRGCFGGLTQSTRGAVDVLDVMGMEIIIIETVGVGQDEIDIVKTAQTTVVVVIPGMGDNIQAIKAGILEAGDIFVINKASREGTEKTYCDIKMMIDLDQKRLKDGRWTPPILKTEATRGKGTIELIEAIDNHKKFLKNSNSDFQIRNKRKKARDILAELVKNRLIEEVFKGLIECGEFERAVNAIAEDKIDPYSACDMLILPKIYPQG